jgi:hypothetical protein
VGLGATLGNLQIGDYDRVNGGEMFGILAKNLPKLKLPRPFAAFAIDAAVEDLGVG